MRVSRLEATVGSCGPGTAPGSPRPAALSSGPRGLGASGRPAVGSPAKGAGASERAGRAGRGSRPSSGGGQWWRGTADPGGLGGGGPAGARASTALGYFRPRPRWAPVCHVRGFGGGGLATAKDGTGLAVALVQGSDPHAVCVATHGRCRSRPRGARG